MPKVIIISIIAVALLIGGIFIASGGSSDKQAQAYADVLASLESGAKLYDVRTPEEFAAGRFAEAANLPLQ